jgi:uncharacterized membrane protein
MAGNRAEAFSDGVFAVAITLLALDLGVAGPGHGSLAHQLTRQWPSYVAYAVSFFTIGIIWVNHHGVFHALARVDRALVYLNLLLLLFVVAIPFATSTMANYLRGGGADARLAMAVYAGVFELMSITFSAVVVWSIRRHLLAAPMPPADERRAAIRFSIGNLAYITAIGIAFVSPYAALGITGLVAVYYIAERTPAPDVQRVESSPTPAP